MKITTLHCFVYAYMILKGGTTMNKMHVIMLYAILLLYTSCELPESDLVYIAQETIPEEIIQGVIKMEIKALQEYVNYYHSNNKVYGIDNAGIHLITIMDTDDKPVNLNSFEVLDGKIYLSVKIYEKGDPIPDTDPVQHKMVEVFYYFCQEDNVISETQDSSPAPPATTIELDSKPYKIVSGDYKGTAISSVFQNTLKINHMPVDGAVHIANTGLYFHVTEPSGTKSGLWYWPMGGNPRWLKETGRLW